MLCKSSRVASTTAQQEESKLQKDKKELIWSRFPCHWAVYFQTNTCQVAPYTFTKMLHTLLIRISHGFTKISQYFSSPIKCEILFSELIFCFTHVGAYVQWVSSPRSLDLCCIACTFWRAGSTTQKFSLARKTSSKKRRESIRTARRTDGRTDRQTALVLACLNIGR